jgi:hypothetical protein
MPKYKVFGVFESRAISEKLPGDAAQRNDVGGVKGEYRETYTARVERASRASSAQWRSVRTAPGMSFDA